jgi:hypothetical protein
VVTGAGIVFHKGNSGFTPRVDSGLIPLDIDGRSDEDVMHIDLNEAIRIHARVGRARYGRGAGKRALKTAQSLRRAGDQSGAAIWERLAAEIDRGDGKAVEPAKTGQPS